MPAAKPESRRARGLPLRDDLPKVIVSRLRASGAITLESTSVKVRFGEIEREVKVAHCHFPQGGSWSLFICPSCSRLAQTLRLYGERVVCRRCDGLKYRCQAHDKANVIERLRQMLYGPKPARTRRKRLETSLRRALILERRNRLV